MKFKQRTTTSFIHVDMRNLKGANAEKLFKQARRCGELDTGYHYILNNTGIFEKDREEKAIAQHNFPDYDTSLYVLADTNNLGKLNDAQNAAMRYLYGRYPDAEIKLRLVE